MAVDVRPKRKVKVKFVGDGDVVQNIIHIKENQKGTLVKQENVTIPLQDIEDVHVENEYYTPTAIVEKNGLSGEEIFTFTSGKSRKAKKETEKKVYSGESDAEENAEFFNSDDEEEQEEASNEQKSSQKRTNTQRGEADDYFIAHKHSKSQTSDNTLSKVNCSLSDLKSLRQLLKDAPDCHAVEKKSLLLEYCSLFKKWMFLLGEGFNILLYGLGSKLPLLDTFCKDMLANCLYIVVNGFFPGLNIKQILNSITEAVDLEGTFQNVSEQANIIKLHFDKLDSEDLYLIIHNIDGTILRAERSQSVLSHIAQASHIHILASVDHINSPLIWDQTKLSQFNWLWFDTTTFCSYTAETVYENSFFVQKSGGLALSSLLHVFHSLTPNAKGIFLILVRWQLDRKDKRSITGGLSFQEYYQQCREAFLVNSDLTMRAQLREFLDHKLLKSHKSTEGVEQLYIPLENSTLSQFLELQEPE